MMAGLRTGRGVGLLPLKWLREPYLWHSENMRSEK